MQRHKKENYKLEDQFLNKLNVNISYKEFNAFMDFDHISINIFFLFLNYLKEINKNRTDSIFI